MLAGASEAVDVDSITVAIGDDGEAKIESLFLKIGADVIGDLKVTPSSSNLFSINVSLAASESKVVDVYADILSTASGTIDSDGVSMTGTGTTANTSISANASAVLLQIITVGASKLAVDIAPDNPDDALVVGQTQNVIMGKYKFSSTYEAFTVSEMKVYASSAKDRLAPRHDKGNLADFVNVWLSYTDSSGVTQTTSAQSTFVNGMMHFTGMTMHVPENGSVNVTIYADLNAVAATGYSLAGSRPQISIAYYKANSGSISALERRVGVFYDVGDALAEVPMTWAADHADFDDDDGYGDYALRFAISSGAAAVGDGVEFNIPIADLGLTVADIAGTGAVGSTGGTITYNASTTRANYQPLFSLWVDCDDDGTFDGEIMWGASATIAADTWTVMTISGATTSDNTDTIDSWWSGGDTCGAGGSGGSLYLANFPDQNARIIGVGFGIYDTSAPDSTTFVVDDLVITTVGGTSYNITVEDDMGSLGTDYVLYKTKPTVTMLGATNEDILTVGSNVLYSFNIAADDTGDVGLKVIGFNITASADIVLNTLQFYKGSTNYTDQVTIVGTSTTSLIAGSSQEGTGHDLADGSATSTYVIFTTEEVIPAGGNQNFYLKGLISGSYSTSSIQTYMKDDPYLECRAEWRKDVINVCMARAYASVVGYLNGNHEFIWSDRSYGSAHSLTSADWLNGFLIKTLGDGNIHTIY
jgi:hypothetical protein